MKKKEFKRIQRFLDKGNRRFELYLATKAKIPWNYSISFEACKYVVTLEEYQNIK